MCQVSQQLKLCTCKTTDVTRLKHYWRLCRHNGGTDGIVGETLLPANIGEAADRLNSKLLLALLNEANCFDVELALQPKDILELHFTCHTEELTMPWEGNFLVYAFVYKNGKWYKGEYDPFGENMDTKQVGKIAKAMARPVVYNKKDFKNQHP
jgi:hypothetical protein